MNYCGTRTGGTVSKEPRRIASFHLNQVGELLSVVTVVAHPPTMEGLGVAILQAMAAGVPIVATSVGGIPEAVQDGVNGILIPPRDVEALSDAVTRLLGAPDLRHTMGTAGWRIVEEQFSVDGMVEGVLSVYYDTLKLEKPSVRTAQ